MKQIYIDEMPHFLSRAFFSSKKIGCDINMEIDVLFINAFSSVCIFSIAHLILVDWMQLAIKYHLSFIFR